MSDSDWLNIIADDSLPSPRTKRKSKFFGCIPPESGSTIFQAWWWDVYNPNLDFTRDSRKANQHKMEQMKVKSPPGVTGVYKCPQKDRPHWKFLQISSSAVDFNLNDRPLFFQNFWVFEMLRTVWEKFGMFGIWKSLRYAILIPV